MAEHVCVCCLRRTAAPGTLSCRLCTGELTDALRELPKLVPLLELLLEPSVQPTTGSRGGGRAHSPAPLRLDVLTLIGPGHPTPPLDALGGGDIPILPMVTGWAGYIATQHRTGWRDPSGTVRVAPADPAPRGATLAAWCTWLLAYLPYALTEPWVAEMHTQITGVTALCTRLVGGLRRPAPVDRPCPECGLYALVQRYGGRGATCESCGAQTTDSPTHGVNR
ncbi:hypothetical protein [Streptomyces phytophilus]|uniref:hypothetical protein n=1 Tax=Streptomyces phytophilus TaxID=722715 RepID=UPI0015F05495|nr:hypothetical protein [Streptomyces phytophilus]